MPIIRCPSFKCPSIECSFVQLKDILQSTIIPMLPLSFILLASSALADHQQGINLQKSRNSYGVKVTSTAAKNCQSLRETNGLIRTEGKKKLRADRRLDDAAMNECVNMARDSITSHYTRGTKPSDRVIQSGYNYQKVAENIASETRYNPT